MHDHYYTQTPTSQSKPGTISVDALGLTLRFHTDAGVFSRAELDFGTRLLLQAMPDVSGRILDMGCGWGAIGTFLARKYPDTHVVMADINQRAVSLARQNLALNAIANAQVIQSDGFSGVEGSFDMVVSNPPIRAGKQVVYQMFDQAKSRMNPGGALVVVIRKQQGAPSALKHLQEVYDVVDILERDKGFWVIRAK